MEKETLIYHFRRSLAAIFDGSTQVERKQISHILCQASKVPSRFANMAVSLEPITNTSSRQIEAVCDYFKEKELAYTWVVNQDDHEQLRERLTQFNFHLMTDIECLHYFASVSLANDHDYEIKPISFNDRDKLKSLITQSFEGGNPESTALFVDEVYLNRDRQAECFFAYSKNCDEPVAYGTTLYYPDEPLAMLAGAATLPEHRGKGLYRALLNHRINQATRLGKNNIIIEAMAETSAPICKHFGFDTVMHQSYLCNH